ncbi:hypothetical protein WN51_14421 [Melipona quadrifasciata]|uniref:Uncharacterized protein n=1 Tax=Melipona quadrifasciata TaxID=166423 RepID=A0A0M8ZXY4_9HYME|nr:hypothetical protein WN51_14421 [Melipona quadrifasciata]
MALSFRELGSFGFPTLDLEPVPLVLLRRIHQTLRKSPWQLNSCMYVAENNKSPGSSVKLHLCLRTAPADEKHDGREPMISYLLMQQWKKIYHCHVFPLSSIFARIKRELEKFDLNYTRYTLHKDNTGEREFEGTTRKEKEKEKSGYVEEKKLCNVNSLRPSKTDLMKRNSFPCTLRETSSGEHMSPLDFIHWEKVRPSSHDIGRRRTLKLELANSPDAVSPQRALRTLKHPYKTIECGQPLEFCGKNQQ